MLRERWAAVPQKAKISPLTRSALNALDAVLGESGLSDAEVCRRIGRGRTYISTMRASTSSPTIDRYAAVAAECGYGLALISDDGERIIRIAGED